MILTKLLYFKLNIKPKKNKEMKNVKLFLSKQ